MNIIEKFNTMTIQELECYGLDAQTEISDSVDEILKTTRCLDLGKTQQQLEELTETSNVITNKFNKGKFLRPIIGVKRWLSRFDNIASRLDIVKNNISEEQNRLQSVLNALYQNRVVLNKQIETLSIVQQELMEYATYLQNNKIEDDDEFRLMTVSDRLNLVTTTIELSKTELVKTALIIRENKEIAYQLKEAEINVIPVFKTMLINSLALEANKRALKLKETLSEVASKATVESAKQIEADAKKLLEGRKVKVVNPKSITEANTILLRAVESISNAMNEETKENLKSIEEFSNVNKRISELLKIEMTNKQIGENVNE